MYEIEKLREHHLDCFWGAVPGFVTSPRRHLVPGAPWGFPRTWFGDTCSQCPQSPFCGMLVCVCIEPPLPLPKATHQESLLPPQMPQSPSCGKHSPAPHQILFHPYRVVALSGSVPNTLNT